MNRFSRIEPFKSWQVTGLGVGGTSSRFSWDPFGLTLDGPKSFPKGSEKSHVSFYWRSGKPTSFSVGARRCLASDPRWMDLLHCTQKTSLEIPLVPRLVPRLFQLLTRPRIAWGRFQPEKARPEASALLWQHLHQAGFKQSALNLRNIKSITYNMQRYYAYNI